jgi:putative SOS response-associated peptidase YedK
MCGRFILEREWREIYELYDLTLSKDTGRNTEARYNIAPTDPVLFVHNDREGKQVVNEGRWWLVPFWAKELPKQPMFNARIETVSETAAFRDAFKSKRCLIPADGFYEWTTGADGKKDPWAVFLPGHAPFSFAGLWAHNDTLSVTSCTIITAPAEDPMTELHTRQPVILEKAVYKDWLAADSSKGQAKEVLSHTLDRQLEFHRVSRDVNSSKFQGKPEVLNPL